MSYSSVWLIVIATGCVALLGVYMLIRSMPSLYLRVLVCALLLALFLTPAPVPGHPLNYAPAFIVAVFEGLLQSGGSPGVAVRMLLVGFALAIAVVTLGALALRRFAGRAEPESPAPE
jgi:hypothetical protein